MKNLWILLVFIVITAKLYSQHDFICKDIDHIWVEEADHYEN